jgi:tetratricopeptide (TPR) repeat protein
MPDLYIVVADESKPLEEKIKILKLLKQASNRELGITNGDRLIGDAYYYQAKICLLPETVIKPLGVDPKGFFDLCQKAVNNGNTTAAIEAGKFALKNKENVDQAQLALKIVLSSVNSTRRIIPGQKAELYCVLGDLYLQTNNKEGAKEAYQKAAAISPESIRGKHVDGNQGDAPEKSRIVQNESIAKLKETEKSIADDKDNETTKKGDAFLTFSFNDSMAVLFDKTQSLGLALDQKLEVGKRANDCKIFKEPNELVPDYIGSREWREAANETFFIRLKYFTKPESPDNKLLYRIEIFYDKKTPPSEVSEKIQKNYPGSTVEDRILSIGTDLPGIKADFNLKITKASTDAKSMTYTCCTGCDFTVDQKTLSALNENDKMHKALMDSKMFDTSVWLKAAGIQDASFKTYGDMINYLSKNSKTDEKITMFLAQQGLRVKSINNDLELSLLVIYSKKIETEIRKAREDGDKKSETEKAERIKAEKAKALDI